MLGEVARGGMGIVYVAAAQGPAGFSKLVALKELRPDLTEDEEFLAMFQQEARTAARLNHPNIVQTNDVDESDGRHFIAMEYLEGRSFYHVLKRFQSRGGFPQRLALSVLRDALAALDYAHELTGLDGAPLGFVHRDVSPHNIFVTYEGHTKVIDFGIAKARDSSLETKTGVLKGRVNYMAPEQLRRRADRRSDIFAVGVILFEILSGRRLWQGMGEIEILAALTRGEIPSLRGLRPDLPPALLDICDRALAEGPEHRFATAAEMRDAIDQHLWATGGAPRTREISEAVLLELDGERQRTRGLIDGALLRLQAGDCGQLETLDAPEPGESSRRGSGRGTGRSFAGDLRSSHGRGDSRSFAGSPRTVSGHTNSQLRALNGGQPSFSGKQPSFGSVAEQRSFASEQRSAAQRRQGQSTTGVERSHLSVVSALEQPTLEPLPPDSDWSPNFARNRAWLIGAALTVVFMATTALVALRDVPPPVVAAAPAPAAAAAAVAPRPAAALPLTIPAPRAQDDTIVLSIGVTPSTAQIWLDGTLLPSNPFVGRFARSDWNHRLRAVAPGHQPKERTVTFDDNVMIELSLDG
ncbi:MAG TPA: serine/threonine-protein kinase, partial [Polyangia bacterium]|nr:serine/threonine-protein kinase [Polyangia bacterium]